MRELEEAKREIITDALRRAQPGHAAIPDADVRTVTDRVDPESIGDGVALPIEAADDHPQ